MGAKILDLAFERERRKPARRSDGSAATPHTQRELLRAVPQRATALDKAFLALEQCAKDADFHARVEAFHQAWRDELDKPHR